MAARNKLFSLFNFDSILESLSGYIENRIELFKLEVKDEASRAIAKLIVLLILNLLLLLVLLFASAGAAMWLNHVLDHDYWGYMIVAGFYLTLFILIITLKEAIGLEKGIQRILRGIFDDLDFQDDDDGNVSGQGPKGPEDKEAA